MKKGQAASRSFRSGDIKRMLPMVVFATFFIVSNIITILLMSAVLSPFAYASAKVVPIPPKRPNVMSASPAYIRQLLSKKEDINYSNNDNNDIYDDAFSYDNNSYNDDYDDYEDYEENSEEKMAVFQDGSPRLLPDVSDYKKDKKNYNFDRTIYSPEISDAGTPIPGHKPSYGSNSIVQRVEDFSDNPSSVELATIAPSAGNASRDTITTGQHYGDATSSSSNTILQPIINSSEKEREKALVSFTLDPKQVSLDKNLKSFLLTHAVKQFKSDPDLRLEIHAYASAEDNQEYSDVRRSLARALEVRSFLLEHNIDPSRLKITPMGHDSDSAVSDRIDLLFIVSNQ